MYNDWVEMDIIKYIQYILYTCTIINKVSVNPSAPQDISNWLIVPEVGFMRFQGREGGGLMDQLRESFQWVKGSLEEGMETFERNRHVSLYLQSQPTQFNCDLLIAVFEQAYSELDSNCTVFTFMITVICIIVMPRGPNQGQGPIVLGTLYTYSKNQSLPYRTYSLNTQEENPIWVEQIFLKLLKLTFFKHFNTRFEHYLLKMF